MRDLFIIPILIWELVRFLAEASVGFPCAAFLIFEEWRSA